MVAERQPLAPVRDPAATLPDLIEVLLNKGVLLHLDLIVAVADVPLIGVSLKAAVAGIETMLEYGMMRRWDAQTRAWVRRSLARDVPFLPGEELVLRAAGGCEAPGRPGWRAGAVYLTDRRLFVHRREPRELLWEAPLDRIRAVALEDEPGSAPGAPRRLRVELADGAARLSAAEPERLLEHLRRAVTAAGSGRAGRAGGAAGADAALVGHLWYREPRAGGGVWRGGRARLDRSTGFAWQSPLDTRPAVRLAPGAVRWVVGERARTPVGDEVVVVGHAGGSVWLAGDDLAAWSAALAALATGEA